MRVADGRDLHREVWMLLPWMATGRLSGAQRELVQGHLDDCASCREELSLQNVIQGALNEPDTVIYAPGPSFRKLLARIDRAEDGADGRETTPRGWRRWLERLGHVSLWRAPGPAWAASFLLACAGAGATYTAYHWSRPDFRTATDAAAESPNVLHIALDRSLRIGEVEELLRDGGARIVEGPGNTGILGVVPANLIPGQTTPARANRQLRALAARLRADPRVLWVQPLSDEDLSEPPAPRHGERP